MFYQCPKCKKTWQYPIEKCPDCFAKLQRLTSKKIKVISVSHIWIPTPLHPKVPYFVLLLEDEKGNRWVQKSIKEYKVGDEYILEKVSGDKNAVAIWRVKYDILEGIEKTTDLLGVKINPGQRVLILPTLITKAHPYFRKNTSPQVLEAMIEFLIKRGIRKENIKVAGQSFDETPITAAAQKGKFIDVCQKHQVQMVNLSQGDFRRIQKGDFVFDVSEEYVKRLGLKAGDKIAYVTYNLKNGRPVFDVFKIDDYFTAFIQELSL